MTQMIGSTIQTRRKNFLTNIYSLQEPYRVYITCIEMNELPHRCRASIEELQISSEDISQTLQSYTGNKTMSLG